MKQPLIVLSCIVSLLPFGAVMADDVVTPEALAPEQVTVPTTPDAVTPEATPSQVTGQVEKQVVAPAAKLTLSRQETKEDSGVGRGFQVYAYTLKNTYSNHLEVLQGEVANSVDEQAVLAQSANSSAAKKRAGSFALRGLATGLSFVPYMGVAGAYAGLATSHVAGSAANIMDASQHGANAATGRFARRLTNVIISPGNTYTFQTLVKKKDTPYLKLVVKDLKTGEIFDIQE